MWKTFLGSQRKKVLKTQDRDRGRLEEIEFCFDGDLRWWECSHYEIEEILYKLLFQSMCHCHVQGAHLNDY